MDFQSQNIAKKKITITTTTKLLLLLKLLIFVSTKDNSLKTGTGELLEFLL